ncbi:MetQ/NlpA family ABC transporter substrate-binding protein [Lactococcus lactis]|uniref:MetQ/NlpA family ABC transporter substrate-binding protein n=1 Tax=Lactococcus lactis TaxID=1358 RepID=UPI003877C15C
MNPRNRNIIIGIIVVVIVAIAAFIGFGQKSQANKTVNKTVKIGIMTGTKEDDSIWQTVSKTAKDKYGITLKFTHFTDYTQPNTALKNGDIDLNAFQHYAFLKAWNKANNGNLVAIGDTVISPISVYSKQLKNISDIKEGGTIAVPNDASNESRALYVLKSAGLIKLDVSGQTLATVKDITSNPKNLVIKELDASQTARALDSVDAAVINNNYAVTAGFKKSDAIFTEPVNKDSQQWINIIVANKKDENNTVYKDVVKAYETEATKKTIAKAYPDKSTIPAWGLKLK